MVSEIIPKLIVTGSSGLLGSNLAKMAADRFDVYAVYNSNKVHINDVHNIGADLTVCENLSQLAEVSPDIIVHCAANTNVDECELDHEKAYAQNVQTSINMAELASRTGAYLIFISTDSVFDGKKGNYSENDTPNPLNVYAKTKLEAENQVLAIHPESCIVRTNIYGWNKREKFSLAEWMLDTLENNRELTAFHDVVFTPILVNHLIEILFKLIEVKYGGCLHIAPQGAVCTKLDFARILADVFELNDSLIKPVSIEDLDLKAPRPKNCSLNTDKVKNALNITLPDTRQGLEEMKKLRNEGYVRKLKNG